MSHYTFASRSKQRPFSSVEKNSQGLTIVQGQHQRVKNLLNPSAACSVIQPRLKVGAPNDKYEQEADQVADQVMRMPDQVEAASCNSDCRSQEAASAQRNPITPLVQRQDELLQPKPEGDAVSEVAPAVSAGIQSLQGGGKPLTNTERRFYEPRFGVGFSGVRIHSDMKANNMAQSVNARAFTLGQDIVFGTGEYSMDASSGRQLLAHELAHVVQQNRHDQVAQRNNTPFIQREPAATPAAAARGTVEDVIFIVSNPSLESNEGLRAAINLLSRYSSHVPVNNIDFRVLPTTSQRVSLGAGLDSINGRAHWEDSTPVIELSQSLLNIATAHAGRTGDPSTADIASVHSLLQTIGHEMYHLWREKEGHSGNPVQSVYEAEASRRMERVRQNWLADIVEPGGMFGNPTRTSLGIDQSAVINTWTDIDQSVRTQIEEGAASTDYINGLYMRSAYLVEEIYAKIEELSFLRVQQRTEPDEPRTASRQGVSSLASLVYRLSNIMNSMVDPNGLITPALLARTRTAMPACLRGRYPNRREPGRDSYEVIFYFSAIRGGLPPLYNDSGQVISALPPEARPPVGTR